MDGERELFPIPPSSLLIFAHTQTAKIFNDCGASPSFICLLPARNPKILPFICVKHDVERRKYPGNIIKNKNFVCRMFQHWNCGTRARRREASKRKIIFFVKKDKFVLKRRWKNERKASK